MLGSGSIMDGLPQQALVWKSKRGAAGSGSKGSRGAHKNKTKTRTKKEKRALHKLAKARKNGANKRDR